MKDPELSDVSTALTSIPATSESEKICIGKLSRASGFKFMSTSTILTIIDFSKYKISSTKLIVPTFQLTGTDLTNTTPSANSNQIVIAESLSTSKNLLVGPFPFVLGVVSKFPSPSTS